MDRDAKHLPVVALPHGGPGSPRHFMRWVMHKEAYGDKIGLRYWERFLGVSEMSPRH